MGRALPGRFEFTRNSVMKTFTVALTLLALTLSASAEEPTKDQASIGKLMRSIWDRPEAPLTVKPITVKDDYAIAGWTQDGRGGRALLHRIRKNKWAIHRCGGDNIKDLTTLKTLGLPAATAEQLISDENAAEKRLPAHLRKKFGSFQGLVGMKDHAKP
jgi:hypothetical protein